MRCKNCNKEHDGLFGSGLYCNRSCANSRKWAYSDKIKKSNAAKNSNKVRRADKAPRNYHVIGLKKGRLEVDRKYITCSVCHKIIETMEKRDQKYHRECWLRISGDIRQGSSNANKGWFNGYGCDSSMS
jgi:hypothetical protein